MADEGKIRRADAIDRLNRQIEKLESMIDALIERVDIEALSDAECLQFVARLSGQYYRALTIRSTMDYTEPENRELSFSAAIMQLMREGNTGGVSKSQQGQGPQDG